MNTLRTVATYMLNAVTWENVEVATISLTVLSVLWLILISCVRLTSTAGYRVFPSREVFVTLILVGLSLSVMHRETIANPFHQDGPPRITGVRPDPETPGLWFVTFSRDIICTDKIALATRESVKSMLTSDCTGEPRSALAFRFKKSLKPGTQITQIAIRRGARIVGVDGEPLLTWYFDPVVVPER